MAQLCDPCLADLAARGVGHHWFPLFQAEARKHWLWDLSQHIAFVPKYHVVWHVGIVTIPPFCRETMQMRPAGSVWCLIFVPGGECLFFFLYASAINVAVVIVSVLLCAFTKCYLNPQSLLSCSSLTSGVREGEWLTWSLISCWC